MISKIIIVLISLILCFVFRISWDQISIESIGGKIIKFNVKKGFGNAIAEKIECAIKTTLRHFLPKITFELTK